MANRNDKEQVLIMVVNHTANELRKQFNNVFEWANVAQDFAFQNDYCSNDYTFAADLAIAEWHGFNAILDTYNRMVRDWFENEKTVKEIGEAILSRKDIFEQVGDLNMVVVYDGLYKTYLQDVDLHKIGK